MAKPNRTFSTQVTVTDRDVPVANCMVSNGNCLRRMRLFRGDDDRHRDGLVRRKLASGRIIRSIAKLEIVRLIEHFLYLVLNYQPFEILLCIL